MKAIVLTSLNRYTIIDAESGIKVKDLDTNIEKYDSPNTDECLIFVIIEDGWMFILPDAFERYFKPANRVAMLTEFVDVEMK